MERGVLIGLVVCLLVAGVAGAEEDMGHLEPAGVGASCATTTATVSWSAVNDNHLAGYNVYEASAPGWTYVRINAGLVTSTQYPVANLQPGTAYGFGVVAVYNDGHTSVMGGPATCTTA